MKELLEECGKFNQNELERETKGLRNNIGMGEKRFRAISIVKRAKPAKHDNKGVDKVFRTKNR